MKYRFYLLRRLAFLQFLSESRFPLNDCCIHRTSELSHPLPPFSFPSLGFLLILFPHVRCHPSILPLPSRSICCCIHFLHYLCWAHELNLNNVETLHLIGHLISENTRALIKKQRRCHTLLNRYGQWDWTEASVCVFSCVCLFFTVSTQLGK